MNPLQAKTCFVTHANKLNFFVLSQELVAQVADSIKAFAKGTRIGVSTVIKNTTPQLTEPPCKYSHTRCACTTFFLLVVMVKRACYVVGAHTSVLS